MKKHFPSEQLELPGFGAHIGYEPIISTKWSSGWFYVAILLTSKMYTLDDAGDVVWLPDDTVRHSPHLFATKWLAQQTANLHKPAIVKRYPWAVDTPKRGN